MRKVKRQTKSNLGRSEACKLTSLDVLSLSYMYEVISLVNVLYNIFFIKFIFNSQASLTHVGM
jgi:hypothetical protein